MTQYINLTTQQLTTESQIRSENPNTSYPQPFPVPDGYALVFDTPQPAYDQYSETISQTTPVLTDKGHYEQQWVITALTGDVLTAAQERKVQDEAAKEAQRIEALWQAATKYEQQAISGSAVGLITLGVIQQLPKATAVQNWIKSIWSEYYARKASAVSDTDFSVVGVCPHTVPELMNELGV
jgi:hypothetical protein